MTGTVGRFGFRLVALCLFALGIVGLVLSWSVSGALEGFLLTGLGAAASALFLMLLLVVAATRTPAPAASRPHAAKVPLPPLEMDSEYDPEAFDEEPFDESHHRQEGILFEYPDEQVRDLRRHAPGGLRATVVDTPRGTPMVDAARNRRDLTDRYTQDAPQVRQILTASGQTMVARPVMAEIANPMMHPSRLPPRTMRGKCGGCETLLLAPTDRPIQLECPSCSRVTLLEQ